MGTLRIASPSARMYHIYVSSEKASHCTCVHTSRDPKHSLGAMVYYQIILAWMLLLKTLNFCGVV